MGKSTKPLSDEIKAKAIELHEAGMAQAKIAEELSIGTSSVYRILKEAKHPPPKTCRICRPQKKKSLPP